MRLLLALLAATLIAGCGFHLRGSGSMRIPYQTLNIALPEHSDIATWLRRYVESAGGTRILPTREGAEAIFQQTNETRQKTILSVNAQGQVREYRLQMDYSFRVIDGRGRELVPINDISVSRDMTYDPNAVLAKDQEEALLWRDISLEVVAQIMRRLAIVKPRNPDRETDED